MDGEPVYDAKMTGNVITDGQELLNLLQSGIHFSFAKFNDGEMALIENANAVASRGYQSGSVKLQDKLKEALLFRASNYYVSLPCKECWPKNYKFCISLLGNIDQRFDVTNANTLINVNVNKTLDVLKDVINKRTLTGLETVLVCSKSAYPERLNEIGFHFTRVFQVPAKNGFDEYDEIYKHHLKLPANCLVVFCCGPVGRVLCYDWFRQCSKITCLELGSLFDPIINHKTYLYHTRTLPFCSTCNPVIEEKEAFSDLNIFKWGQIDFESLHYFPWETALRFFRDSNGIHYVNLLRYYQILANTGKHGNNKAKCLEAVDKCRMLINSTNTNTNTNNNNNNNNNNNTQGESHSSPNNNPD